MKRHNINTDDVIQRYRSGASEKQVASEFGVGRNVIRRRLVERGEPVRGRSAAELTKWAHMTATQRSNQVKAAHAASAGRPKTAAEQALHAATVERLGLHAGPDEHRLASMLRARGFEVTQQKAVGPYNCDLAVDSVAVEVFGGEWQGGSRDPSRAVKRLRYLLDHGWYVLMIKVERHRRPMTEYTADYVADFVDAVRRRPPPRCEYRVIRSDGEALAAGSAQNAEVAFVHPFRLARDLRTGRYQRASR